jgi:hypothetical protein
MSIDPGDVVGEAPPAGKPGPGAAGSGCGRGCLLVGGAVVLFLLVGVLGLGLPYTYWHRLAEVQAFEGPDRVVLFVEVQRAMNRPGLFPGAYAYDLAAALWRIDVFPDGRVERTPFRLDDVGDDITLNTNLYTVVRLAEGFYLVERWREGRPRPVYRLGPEGIRWLPSKEVIRATGQDVLEASSDPFDLSKVDAISLRRGWRRLNRERGGGPYLRLGSDPIDSARHGLRLWHLPRWWDWDEPESLVAESSSPTDHWTRTLIEVDTRRWKSYREPGDRAYVLSKYAASPAH